MNESTTLTVRLPISVKHQIEALAQATKRSKSFCVLEAIKAYVELEAWQIEAVKEGLRDIDAGKTVSHSKVKDWVLSWDTAAEKERPACD